MTILTIIEQREQCVTSIVIISLNITKLYSLSIIQIPQKVLFHTCLYTSP